MSLQTLAEELRESLDALRTTIRFGREDGFPVLAEACAPGAWSVRDTLVTLDPRPDPLVFLDDELRILVQEDVLASPPVTPIVVERYGARAQMLAPCVKDGQVDGIVSVHNAEPRRWTEEEVALLAETAARIQAAQYRGGT